MLCITEKFLKILNVKMILNPIKSINNTYCCLIKRSNAYQIYNGIFIVVYWIQRKCILLIFYYIILYLLKKKYIIIIID